MNKESACASKFKARENGQESGNFHFYVALDFNPEQRPQADNDRFY